MLEFAHMLKDDTKALKKFFLKSGVRNYKKGDVIIRSDDEPAGIYLIDSGFVKMSSTFENGTETAVNVFKPGTFFPMTWAIGGIANDYNYTALSPLKLYKASKDEFVKFLKDNPDILFDLMKRVFIGLDGVLFNLKHLLHGNSYQRVAVTLYMMARRFGSGKKINATIGIPLTHLDISHFSGLTRETTTIMVNKLEKAGIITQNKRKITIKNLEALEKIFID
jgi:CRP/FNR family transcriptional regulator